MHSACEQQMKEKKDDLFARYNFYGWLATDKQKITTKHAPANKTANKHTND